jgi:hypothetical protein
MNHHSKRECRELIAEKHLPLQLVRIGQVDRLREISPDGKISPSSPVFSWDRLYTTLSEMPAVVHPVEELVTNKENSND